MTQFSAHVPSLGRRNEFGTSVIDGFEMPAILATGPVSLSFDCCCRAHVVANPWTAYAEANTCQCLLVSGSLSELTASHATFWNRGRDR
jgi:hypothetical protein